MKRISYWAKAHKWPSRIIIILSFFLLNVLGIFTGELLTQLNISIPTWLMINFFSIFLVAMMAYPSKKLKGKLSPAVFYVRQKSCDLLLVTTTFCMLVYLGNNPDKLFQFYPSLHATTLNEPSLPKDSLTKRYRSVKEFTASMKDENGNDLKWKEKKKLLKEQVNEIKKANDLSAGEKTLLVIVSVLAALGLIFLIAALSCSISCGGSDALAAIVGFGGTALVVYLLVIVIRSIYGKRKRQKQASEKPATG